MSGLAHKIYLFSLVTITVFVFIYLAVYGTDYYLTDHDQRFFHDQNELLKPGGFIGHGAGIIGALLMTVGVFGYMARKRFRSLARLGVLKHWLEFHIFLCSLGPVLVLYHTAFKFGGLVAISFWSMVAVVVSGIIGRFIYLQIPRTIEGRAMSMNELNIKKAKFNADLKTQFSLDSAFVELVNASTISEDDLYKGTFFSKILKRLRFEKQQFKLINTELRTRKIPKSKEREILRFVRAEIVLGRRIAWLTTMQNYLRYWHVLHLPFALIMLIIMIVHIIIALLFGSTWIF
ncbi:hypothetical protein OU798_12050 [Prolixibacteraceae bacterium Z1-6]|uniref:Uncharacterized protein n=1 Tax=Draconibacterium aestuarii TaxID=2998507 RepID=A0A9X3J7V0_9BACT|nr:hypothetical protein [Prolixibacteraceae bacterium Z1-6]